MRIRRVLLRALSGLPRSCKGPVCADVVVGNPVFTDHRKVTLHKYVNFDHPDVARELGRRARASVTATNARLRRPRSANGLSPRPVPGSTDEP